MDYVFKMIIMYNDVSLMILKWKKIIQKNTICLAETLKSMKLIEIIYIVYILKNFEVKKVCNFFVKKSIVALVARLTFVWIYNLYYA